MKNVCCFITLRRPECPTNGVGQDLLPINIVNQISVGFLAFRPTPLVVNITSYRVNPWLDTLLCSTFSPLVLASSRISHWLVVLIAIERANNTMFVNQWCDDTLVDQVDLHADSHLRSDHEEDQSQSISSGRKSRLQTVMKNKDLSRVRRSMICI